MKKISVTVTVSVFAVVVIFSSAVNVFARDPSFEDFTPADYAFVGVADFPTFNIAKGGGVGNNFRRIPEHVLYSSSLTAPRGNTPATCVVNEDGKAVDKQGKLIGYCENSEAVIFRIKLLNK